jgi:hypothetical protein
MRARRDEEASIDYRKGFVEDRPCCRGVPLDDGRPSSRRNGGATGRPLAQSRASTAQTPIDMKIPALVHALAAVALLGTGCAATDDQQQPADTREQAAYRTGSNIGKRDPRPKTQEERERAAAQAEQSRRDAEKILRPGG